jgi:hypothetical protein
LRSLRHSWAAYRLAIATLVATISLAMGACQTVQPPRTILVPCKVERVIKPAMPADTLAPDADIFIQSKTLLADRKVRIGYEGKLETAAEVCR